MLRQLAVFGLALGLVGCLPVAFTGDPPAEETPVATPEDPHNPYSNEDYAAALRAASSKLRGRLPDQADTSLVRSQGRLAYESLIDEYVDSDAFINEMHALVSRSLEMGGDQPDAGGVIVDTNAPADLASYLIDAGLPWRDILSLDTCVSSFVDGTGKRQFTLSDALCTNNLPPEERAGVVSLHSLLYVYGQSNTFNLQRTSIVSQFATCKIYPVGESPLKRTNATEPGGPPELDPAEPPRIHTKYQGAMINEGAEVACASCHSALLSRRNAFAKFDRNGFYDPTRTINDVELPEENEGMCYVVPFGMTKEQLTPCDQTSDPLLEPGGCCFEASFTDEGASENFDCRDPSMPCTGIYGGTKFSSLKEYAQLILADEKFDECQTERFIDYAVGSNTGSISVSAGVGDLPFSVDDDTIEKYRSLFSHEGWNVRELMRALFKGDEFLESQVQ